MTATSQPLQRDPFERGHKRVLVKKESDVRVLAYLPSPSQGVWHLGPVPVRAYAPRIMAGIAERVKAGETVEF